MHHLISSDALRRYAGFRPVLTLRRIMRHALWRVRLDGAPHDEARRAVTLRASGVGAPDHRHRTTPPSPTFARTCWGESLGLRTSRRSEQCACASYLRKSAGPRARPSSRTRSTRLEPVVRNCLHRQCGEYRAAEADGEIALRQQHSEHDEKRNRRADS